MKPWMHELLSRPAARGVGMVLAAIVAAYVVEFIIRKTLVVLARKTETDLDDAIIEALRRPIFLTVIFIGCSWAGRAAALPERALGIVHGVLETLAILVWMGAAVRVGLIVLDSLGAREGKSRLVQPSTLPALHMMLKVLVVATGLYFVFLAWKIDLTAWLASAGILGVAAGFAAKDSLANFFSGIFILADSPYRVGDYIVLDGGLRGEVTRIGFRSTRILTRDDVEITVPNAMIASSKIINETGGPYVQQRVPVCVSIAYGSSVEKAREVLLGCVEGVAHVCDTPEPQVRFRRFGGSGLELELLVWLAEPAERGNVLDVLNTKVYNAFAEAGLEIPYSKHDVYIKGMVRPDDD